MQAHPCSVDWQSRWSVWVFSKSFWARIGFTGTVFTWRIPCWLLLIFGCNWRYTDDLFTLNPSLISWSVKSSSVKMLRYISSCRLSWAAAAAAAAADPCLAILTIFDKNKCCVSSCRGFPGTLPVFLILSLNFRLGSLKTAKLQHDSYHGFFFYFLPAFRNFQ